MDRPSDTDDSFGSSLRMIAGGDSSGRLKLASLLAVVLPGSSISEVVGGLGDALSCDDRSWQTTTVRLTSAAADVAAESRPDMVLVAAGNLSVRDLRSLVRDLSPCPIVIVDEDWSDDARCEAIRLGVSDCVPAAELTSESAARIVRHAMIRGDTLRSTDTQTVRRSAGWVRGPDRSVNITSRTYARNGLRDRDESKSDGFQDQFRELVQRALRQRYFSSDAGLTDDIDGFACELGHELATPADLHRLYKQAIKEMAGSSGKRRKVIRVEAEYVLLGVMARLVNYYRVRAVGPEAAEQTVTEPATCLRQS